MPPDERLRLRFAVASAAEEGVLPPRFRICYSEYEEVFFMSERTNNLRQNAKTVFCPPLAVWVCCALLTAAGAVLKTLTFNIPLGGLVISRLGFHLIAVYLAALLFGPFMGALTGIFSDFLSMLIAPIGGSYNPLYTLTFVIAAITAWAVYNGIGRLGLLSARAQKRSWKNIVRTVITVVCVQLIFLCVNTLWISLFSGSSYFLLLSGRALGLIFYIPVFTVLLCILIPVLQPFAKRLYAKQK